MVEYILGNYLIQSGKLTNEYFNGIIGKLDKVHVRLGIIAVAEGMMSIEQADEVNQLQSVVDKRFGDIAIEKGYLTEAQISNLLKAQGNTFMTFIQALVNEGFINLREIDNILEAFRIENSFSKSDMEILKRDDTDVVIPLFLTPETLKYQEIISIAIRTIIRCIDRHVYIGKAALLNEVELHNASMQLVDGENGFVSAFAEKNGGLLELASIFGQEQFSYINDDSLDAAGEFLNCINGLYASALSQKGEILELMPPKLVAGSDKITGQLCSIPIFIKNKQFDFIIKNLRQEGYYGKDTYSR